MRRRIASRVLARHCVRAAISAYVVRRRRKSKSVGLGRGGKGTLSERAEELLSGIGRKQ